MVRTAVRALVRIYYPKIEISERHRIPKSGPVLLVANHANSLIDPVILGLIAARPVHFLAKAPLFEIPIFGTALRALGMVPAYRGSDDPTQVKNNLKSLSAAADFLQRNEAVGIFPEGKSHDATKVDRVKSGAARIALAAFKNGANSLTLVPVGINYERKERFRSSIWVRVGEPISMSVWLAKQTGDEPQILRALTAEIDRRLKEVVVHLNEENWEPFLRDLEILVPPRNKKQPVAAIRQRKRIADGINYFAEHDRHRVARVAVGIKRFREKLDSVGIKMNSRLLWSRGWRRPLRMAGNTLWLILVLVPAFLGAVHNIAPFLLVRGISYLIRQPGRMTLSLVRLGIGIPIFAAWYFLVWRWMIGYFLPWVAWTWTATMPFAGVLALNYFSRSKQNASVWKEHFLLFVRPSQIAALRDEQNKLRAQLSELDEAYNQFCPAEPAALEIEITRKMVVSVALRWTLVLAVLAGLFLWSTNHFKNNRLVELQFAGPNWSNVSTQSLSAQLDSDEKALLDILGGLSELEIRAAELRREFASEQRTYYRQADNDAIRKLLLGYLNYRTALLRLVWKYQTYETVTDEKLRLRSFLDGLTAGAGLYEASLKFVSQHQDPVAIRKLNEAEPLWGIPPNLLDTIHRNLIQPENRKMFAEALKKYQHLQPAFQKNGLNDQAPYVAFHATIQHSVESVKKFKPMLAKETLKGSIADATAEGKEPIYKIKSFVSMLIGDTKIREPRQGKSLIQPQQVVELRNKLRPGDIIIERRNWFLSNAFLPGYWPHSALYVGTKADLEKLGLSDDPRLKKHWQEFLGRDEAGHEHVIIESVSEGVVFSSLEHSIGGGDSAAVVRPRLAEARIREAIARAFSHVGKPYDFEFDFFTTDKLVCTELVYRAYDGDIQFPLVEILGTKTMPALEIVRKFSNERGTTNAQLDFISFLDGDEKKGRARFVDEKIFMETLHRPALTWLQ
ncbi:MAG: 1-acyl-sn-glycerol-3-phosphate acyltransferase [Verrucomicrobiota bacterium]